MSGETIHRNPMMMQGNTFALRLLLKATYHHQGRIHTGMKPIRYNGKNGGTEKQHHHPLTIFFIFLDHLMITHMEKEKMRVRYIQCSKSVVGLVNHCLACIEVNLYTTVGLTASCCSVVGNRVARAETLHRLHLRIGLYTTRGSSSCIQTWHGSRSKAS